MGKTIIYQMLPRLWGEGKFSSVDEASLRYFQSLGVTHIWLTGLPRHSSGKPFVKGDPGCPYAVCDWFDTNAYLADNESERMAELESLFRRIHNAGMKVVMDFIPNHVGRDYGETRARKDVAYLGDGDDRTVHWKDTNDFFYYPSEALRLPDGVPGGYFEYPAKASGNCYSPCPSKDDWYDTVRLNYCPWHTPTWDRMLEVLMFWAGKGADAFRCDMVEMVPVEFMQWAMARVREVFPGVEFIAEVYDRSGYGKYLDAGFDLLYDKSGLYDILRGVVRSGLGHAPEPPFTRVSASDISAHFASLGAMQDGMLNFLENHDEQRFASPFYASDASGTFASLALSLLYNRAPFMLYFGEECGEAAPESDNGRTSIFDGAIPAGLRSLASYARYGEPLPAHSAALLERFRALLALAAEDIVSEGETVDLCALNAGSEGFDLQRHFAFERRLGGRKMVVFCNFSPSPASVSLKVLPEGDALWCRVAAGPWDYSIIDCR